MKPVKSTTFVISLLMTEWNQFANCTTLTWPTECATLFMDLPLLLSNHALMMTWYPGQACRVMIYPVAIYKLKLFIAKKASRKHIITYTINYQQLKITLMMFQMKIQLTWPKAQQWQRVTLWLIQSFQSFRSV